MDDNVRDLFFDKRPVGEQAPAIHHDMERAVEQLQAAFPEDMAAFVIVAVDRDGLWSTRHSIRHPVIGARMLAGLATMAIAENLVVEKCISERLGQSD